MTNLTLKDPQGRRIGKKSIANNGIITIKDSHGRKMGSYDPRSNKTKDRHGRIIGSGDLLTTLLDLSR